MSNLATIGSRALVVWLATAPVSAAVRPDAAARSGTSACPGLLPQDGQADALERLQAMLSQSGPDGREAREAAIEQLLAMPQPAAHRLLQKLLLRQEDADGVAIAILTALQRYALGSVPLQFGGAPPDARQQILTGYLGALIPLWREVGADSNTSPAAPASPVFAAARLALQRLPARELDAAARTLLGAGDADGKMGVLRCLADLQQVLFTTTIADYLEAPDPRVRDCARASLQLLTYENEAIQTKAQFDAWFANNGTLRYVDLAERAARSGLRPSDRMRADLERLRIDAARDVVRVLVVRTPVIDWAAVQERTLVDDPPVLDACLELLQQTLVNNPPVEDASAARQGLSRGLIQRFRAVGSEHVRRRWLLLEVAAYLARVDETELATEITTLLSTQLRATDFATRVSALRALRRFPTVENRQRLVLRARELLPEGAAAHAEVAAILATLSTRTPPRWTAPLPTDPDCADWLELVLAACRSGTGSELREPALLLGQLTDQKEQRVAGIFELLLSIVADGSLDTKFRLNSLIHLQAWGRDTTHVEAWIAAMHRLLTDSAPELRVQAAESLSHLRESADANRGEWIASTFVALRDRLPIEPDSTVFRALVDCLQVCGLEPQMPERAIGVLRSVLNQIGPAVAPENQFRLEPLLQALSAIAANPRADRGQWLAACPPLLLHKKRQSLRNILQSHAAIDMAKDVASPDAGQGARARQAMSVLIETALLKPTRDVWTDSEELLREARDVRAAFGTYDTIDDPKVVEGPSHRLLRLEVELACGKHQEVVQRGMAWLLGGSAAATVVKWSAEERQRVQMLVAEAHLAQNKPDAALLVVEDATAQLVPTLLDLQSRIARALESTNMAAAVALTERVWRATPTDDAAFRQRLVDWMQCRVRSNASARDEVVRESEKYVALFTAPDCPVELRGAFEQLRAAR